MREVWGRIEQLDKQTVVKRARRLNTIFAILLVVALWASGFAFIQARKAKRATDAAMLASVESDKSAGAAVDLMLLFVSELNKGDISGAGADRLYSIVSENAQTFLDNRSKDRLTSTRILRFSAQTAALRGRQALEREDFDEALKDFTSAYEIRSELAEDPNSPDDFALLASRDLMEIGKIHELKIDYKEAAAAYSAALEWRSQVSGESGLFSLAQIKELATNYKALSRVQELGRDTKSAIATLNEILSIVNRRIEDGAPSDVPGYALEAARVLLLRGAIEYSSGNITEASTTYQSLMTLVKSLSTAPPSLAEEARGAHLEALRSLGLIQLDQKQPEAALVLFREEIKIREEATSLRPYDAEAKVSLADAYAYAAQSLDLTTATSRSLATFYLEQAVALVDKLPTDIKTRSDINVKLTRFKSSLSEIMGM